MSEPLILTLKRKVEELNSRINNKHELFSGGLHSSNEGEEVSANLGGNVSDYNFFICRVRKWNEVEEKTTVVVSTTDEKQFFRLDSALKTYYAVFAITITSDNKVKFQCCDLEGWEWKDNIQLEKIWGI